jgi:Tol biopolymer transport system component
MTYRTLAVGQRCQVLVTGSDGVPDVVWESDELLLEAPNWTLDGTALILNGNGLLWRFDLESRQLEPIEIDVPELNNDHVLAPDGATVFLSADDGHIYRAPLGGGEAVRVTNDIPTRLHFLHGVSPDGSTLAYVGVEPEGDDAWAHANIFTIPADGGPDVRLTADGPADGCEYSPDGSWVYFNTEQFSTAPGHAQIARMRPDGSELEQLTFDDRVNWFPHLSPDGAAAVYLSFPPGTTGHPADLDVELKLVHGDGWRDAATLVRLPGGQGTINVNSWAPTSDRFAFVSYPTS